MTQITDEMKVAAVKAYIAVDGKCRPAAMVKALEAVAALSRPIDPKAEVEPIILQRPDNLVCGDDGRMVNGHFIYALEVATSMLNLRSASPSIVAPVGVPKGWQIVPKEPTDFMIAEAIGCDWRRGEETIRNIWQHMLAASAPICPTCDGTGKEGRHSICRDCDDDPALTPAEKSGVGDGDAERAILTELAKARSEYMLSDQELAARILRALSTTKPAQGDGELPPIAPIRRGTDATWEQVISLFRKHRLPDPPTSLRDELVIALEWAWFGHEGSKR